MSANDKWLARKADPKYRAYMKEYLRKYMRGYHARRLARLRKERGNKCRVCSATESLHFAHRTPTGLSGRGRGQGERQRDIVRNPRSYVLVCRDCHAEMDRKTKTWCNPTNYARPHGPERMSMAKKTVKEPEAQTMGGELIDEPKAKKTAKKAAPKKAVKKTAKKAAKTKPKGKTKAEILSKPTKVVRKSVVKNEEHSEFEGTDAADIADEVEQDGLDDIGEEETDDSIEY